MAMSQSQSLHVLMENDKDCVSNQYEQVTCAKKIKLENGM